MVDGGMSTLYEVARRKTYQAGRGVHGKGSGLHGARGQSEYARVPAGTQVWRKADRREGQLVGDLVEDGQVLTVAWGGLGGWGNARFATATYQAPRIAQRGGRGGEAVLILELKLLADVGIIGLPNVGKSTLLGTTTAGHPKVGDYPFTTLEPSLGVAMVGGTSFVLADIPGLIEGAHRGAGLGLEFLRHVERTRLLVHLLDGRDEDVLAGMDAVNAELRQYDERLAAKDQVVAVNKLDLAEVRKRVPEVRRALEGRSVDPLFISAASGEGVDNLLERLAGLLAGERAPPEAAPVPPEAKGRPKGGFRVSHDDSGFRVEGERVVTFAEMMPVEVEEGRAEFWRRLGRMGVVGALRRAGARPGDTVRFGGLEVEWEG